VVQLLLSSGATGTVVEGILGQGALHRCVDGEQGEVLTWLLADAKLDPNVADLRGHTPAALACTKV
jgi:hypothetical protein